MKNKILILALFGLLYWVKKKFSLIILSLLLIFAVGCKKPESDSGARTKKLFDVSSTNPYDSIGILHNNCMDYFANNADLTNYATSSNGAISIVKSYIKSQNIDTTGMYTIFSSSAFQTIYGGNLESDTNEVITLLNNNGMSGAVRYIHLMNAAFTANMFSSYSETDSLNQFQTNLDGIQSSVNADVSLSSNEKQVLLIALDVADRSANYWQNQNQLGSVGSFLSHLWNQITHPHKWVWEQTVQLDYDGAVVGAVAGSILFGNLLGGAILGALDWSIIDVLVQLY